jgi:hypothetical protein
VLPTHDQLQFLAPRFAAIRDSLKNIPGVTVVADISPLTVDEAGGAATMRTILLAEPEIDVFSAPIRWCWARSPPFARPARRGRISS